LHNLSKISLCLLGDSRATILSWSWFIRAKDLKFLILTLINQSDSFIFLKDNAKKAAGRMKNHINKGG
jgi:hypothetical protein